MPSFTAVAALGGKSDGRRADVRRVAGAEDAAEQGDAEGAAELAHGVVERRGDALLLLRQRRGDRGRVRAHRQADADAEHQEPGSTGQYPPSALPRPSSPAAPSRRRRTDAEPISIACDGRSAGDQPGATAESGIITAAIGSRPTAAPAPSSRAPPAGTGPAPGRGRTCTANMTSRSPSRRRVRGCEHPQVEQRVVLPQLPERRRRQRRRTPTTRPTRGQRRRPARSGPSWMPSTSAPMASAERNEPPTSKRPSCAPRESCGTKRTVIAQRRPRSDRHRRTATAT